MSRYQNPRGTRRTPSGSPQSEYERRYRPRPAALRLPIDDSLDEDDPLRQVVVSSRDYNLLSMSDFKINPSLYMYWTKDHPLAITRYGRIYSMIVSLPFYNDLLQQLRDSKAKILRYRKVLNALDPGMVKLLDQLPEATDTSEKPAYWPLLHQEPKRKFSSEVTKQDLLDALERIDALYELQRPDEFYRKFESGDESEEELDPYEDEI